MQSLFWPGVPPLARSLICQHHVVVFHFIHAVHFQMMLTGLVKVLLLLLIILLELGVLFCLPWFHQSAKDVGGRLSEPWVTADAL
jgi:hypothetical protein